MPKSESSQVRRDVRINPLIPADVHDRLKAHASAARVPLAGIVRMALNDFLARVADPVDVSAVPTKAQLREHRMANLRREMGKLRQGGVDIPDIYLDVARSNGWDGDDANLAGKFLAESWKLIGKRKKGRDFLLLERAVREWKRLQRNEG